MYFWHFQKCQNIYKEDEYFNNNGKAACHVLVMTTVGIQLRFDKSIEFHLQIFRKLSHTDSQNSLNFVKKKKLVSGIEMRSMSRYGNVSTASQRGSLLICDHTEDNPHVQAQAW